MRVFILFAACGLWAAGAHARTEAGEVLALGNHVKITSFDLKPYVAASAAEILSGPGAAGIDGGKLAVSIPEKLGYLWLKLRR